MSPASVVGPGSVNIDMAVARLFRIRERMSVMIRAEAFNVANHVNPGDPTGGQGRPGGVDLTLTDGNFGKILTTNDPRIMQVAMKFVF